MIKILFVCHGNICRSPMAEFVMKDLVKKAHLEDQFEIASAATSTEEIWGGRGNPVYPPARAKLKEHGIDPGGKRARRTTREDYKYYDYLIGMDYANTYNMKRIYGGDPDGKVSLLLDYCGRTGQEVADPWYTDDFDATWDDVLQGCTAQDEPGGRQIPSGNQRAQWQSKSQVEIKKSERKKWTKAICLGPLFLGGKP